MPRLLKITIHKRFRARIPQFPRHLHRGLPRPRLPIAAMKSIPQKSKTSPLLSEEKQMQINRIPRMVLSRDLKMEDQPIKLLKINQKIPQRSQL